MLLPLMLAALTVGDATESRPNFVLIITDDISYDDLGCYGNPVVKTPALDRMAEQGMRFTNAYLTCSSCSPSRCSLITGRYPHNTGACELHVPLPPGHVLFPELLKQAGYYTAISGKHHMGPHVDRAFDLRSSGEGPGKEEDWVAILKGRPKDQPFFLWFASTDAHRSWSISEDAPTYEPEDVEVPPYLVDGPLTRQDLANYYHEVSRTDTFAGRLAEELQRQGIAESTYVIYLSDNGRPFPRCKTRLYDSGIKSPLIVYAPGQIQPATSDSLISVNIDLGPTILELAGVEPHARIQGVSFVEVLRNPDTETRDLVFAEQNWHVMQAHQRMVRHGDWVYIRNNYPHLRAMCVESTARFPAGKELWQREAQGRLEPAQRDIFVRPRPSEELYHVAEDRHQLRNLVHADRHSKRLQRLRTALDVWEAETLDSVPENPTLDREDAQGNKYGGWKHREQPGVERGSVETENRGPTHMVSVLASSDEPTKLLGQGAGEGPAWHPAVGLIFSGGGGINRFVPPDRVEPYTFGDDEAYRVSTNGLLFDSRGRLICCENEAGRVTRIDSNGNVEVLTAQYNGAPYNQPNDLTIDSRGRIYFSDPKYGSRDKLPQRDESGKPVEGVYRVDSDGAVTRVIQHEVDRPNGVLVTQDDRYLFVADNNNNQAGGARKLWRFELRDNGDVNLSSRTLMHDWGSGRGPDGMVQGDAGRLYVAAGRNEPTRYETVDADTRGGIYIFDTDGHLIDFVAIPHDEVTNCTLAGPQRDTLYITAGGTLWRLNVR